MKNIFVIILFAFLFLCISVYAAGTPSIFSYQGRLADSNGDLLGDSSGTTYYFKFSIWDNAAVDQGSKLWPTAAPTATPATVREGVFNVNIGDIASGYPDILNLDFNTDADIYLQVRVCSSENGDFETLSPRQRIASAVFSQLTGAVSGTGQSSFGTTSPFSSAVVTVEATTTSDIPIVIQGIAGQVADLFRIISNTESELFTVTADGDVEISGNVIVDMSVIFGNGFYLKTDGSIIGLYDPTDPNTAIIEFDEGE